MFSFGYLYRAGIKMDLIEECSKQRCFASAIFANQTDAASGMNCPIDVIEQFFL